MAQGLRQGCVLSPRLSSVFFAAILLVAPEKFSEDADKLADLAPLREQPSKIGPETVLEYARGAIWGMLHADDARIVSRSPPGMERMMAVFVQVLVEFGLTISERRTETMSMPMPRAPATLILSNAVGQLCRQTTFFTHLGGAVTQTPDLADEVDGRIRAGWMSFRRYTREMYDRPRRQVCCTSRPGW